MSLKISIPKPCSENWNQMTPTQKGAFCQSCSKEVLDFTNTSKTELARKLDTDQNICGRFKPEQLNTPLPSITRSNFKRNAVMLGFTSLLAATSPVMAQQGSSEVTEVPTNDILGRIAVRPITPPKTNIIELKGVITDGENPLPGANIFVKGTQIKTQSDFNGNFNVALSNFYKDSKVTLTIYYIGFISIEKEVTLNSKSVQVTLTEMEEDIMGDLVITYKPNIFKRIGNLFRKKY